MFIGRVSELTGVSRKTIRYYEAIGLLRPPTRSGTYRVFDDHHVSVINAIKRAQSLGFRLAELKVLMETKYTTDRFPVAMAIETIDRKTAELGHQIATAKRTVHQLRKLKTELQELRQ